VVKADGLMLTARLPPLQLLGWSAALWPYGCEKYVKLVGV